MRTEFVACSFCVITVARWLKSPTACMVDLVEKYEKSRDIVVVLSKYKVVGYTEGEVQMYEWNGP